MWEWLQGLQRRKMWELFYQRNEQHHVSDWASAENSPEETVIDAGRRHDSQADTTCSYILPPLPPDIKNSTFEQSGQHNGRMHGSRADMIPSYDLPPLPPELIFTQPFEPRLQQFGQPPSELAFFNGVNNGFMSDYAYHYHQQGIINLPALGGESFDPRLASTRRLSGQHSDDWPLATSSHWGDNHGMHLINRSLPTNAIDFHRSAYPNPTHGRFIQGNVVSVAAADQPLLPTNSAISNINQDGVARRSENTALPSQSVVNPTYTKPTKRGPGRPPGSSSVNKAPRPMLPTSTDVKIHHIRIGEWQQTSKTSWDMLVKCYLSQQRLIWELLSHETKIKSRIIIDWKNISSIKMKTDRGMLQLELSKAPYFGHEKEIRTGVHSLWGYCKDFTGGEASRHWVHTLAFKRDMFKKFIKMLNNIEELRGLMIEQWDHSERNNMAEDPNRPDQHKGKQVQVSNVAMRVANLQIRSASISSSAETFMNIRGTENDSMPWNDPRQGSSTGWPLSEQSASLASDQDSLEFGI